MYVCTEAWVERIINLRIWRYHLRNESSAKACCTGRINTIIHVSTQCTTNNNVKWITNTLKVQANVTMSLSHCNAFSKMFAMMKVILTITYRGLSSGKEAVH